MWIHTYTARHLTGYHQLFTKTPSDQYGDSNYLHNYIIFVVKIHLKISSLKWHPFSSALKAHRSKCQPMIWVIYGYCGVPRIALLWTPIHLAAKFDIVGSSSSGKCYRSTRICHILASANDIIDLPRPLRRDDERYNYRAMTTHFTWINS